MSTAEDAAAREAATLERQQRLENARRKLKKYRARQSKTSVGSSMSSISSGSKRDSTHSDAVASPRHRKSASRSSLGKAPASFVSPAPKGHARRVSGSRGSRGASFSGHGHTRSRASVSISVSSPTAAISALAAGLPQLFAPTAERSAQASPKSGLDAPLSWRTGTFPSSPDLRRGSFTASPGPPSAISHFSSPSLPSTSTHGRRASRHSRHESVSNFRQSLDLLSGHQHGSFSSPGGTLQPGTSSFAPADGGLSAPPSPAMSNRSMSPNPWANSVAASDPARVLDALKERGRRESDTAVELDPERTRNAALEALEGRLSAPSETIDLGSQPDGALPAAPPSPGRTVSFPSSTVISSPVLGLGLSGRRNSWGSTPGPVTAAGAKGAMDLGMLVEEEEDEADDENDVAPLPTSPKKRGSSPKKRPASLFLTPSTSRAVPVSNSPGDIETPFTSSFSARPMRLSLSLSSTASSFGTPSTAGSVAFPPPRPASLRSLTLGASPASTSAPFARSGSAESETSPTANEKRPLSLFHSVAVETVNGTIMSPSRSHSPTPPAASPAPRGLRSLSIGTFGKSAGPASPSAPSDRSFSSGRTSSTAGPPSARSATAKRSSISYRTTSLSSLSSPDGPLSSSAQAARRPWRPESFSASPAVATPSNTIGGYAFPFAPLHGNFGGFGELEVAETDEEAPPSLALASPVRDDDRQGLVLQIASLRTQIEQLTSQNTHLGSTHALEIAEFEKKAGEEARGMRMRIAELERNLEEGRVVRRFEVEGLQREVEQAREAIADVTEERDALREDVDGWRARCSSLQAMVKKEHDDDAMAAAQAKLIGEMRDQIYNLVAALERERGEHAETRNEIERLLIHRASPSRDEHTFDEEDEEAAIGSDGRGEGGRRHGFQSVSDGSVLSSSSFGRSYSGNTTEDTSITTDLDDSFSGKMSSPPSGHSSFGQAIGFPAGSKRDSDFGTPGLHTLTEEEEDEEAARAVAASSSNSTSPSEGMPPTPNKETPVGHQRSDSFVRHWSFPKGSVSSLRIVDDEVHSFFDLNRHTSLPALPITDSILPPFLHADLTVDDDEFAYEPLHHHVRRPSSPRPLQKMVPHTRRFSGQFAAKAPPVSPSALAHVAISTTQTSSTAAPVAAKGFARFGMLIGTLGGWAPGATPVPIAPAVQSKLAISTTVEVDEMDETDVFLSSTRHETPPSLLHSSRQRQRYIKTSQQPIPRPSRLGLLDFTPICCSHETIVMV